MSPTANTETPPEAARRARMPLRTRILFFAVAWAIVLMPFLFWRSTWFGRPLSDKDIQEYLHEDKKPRHIQHALVQVGERMGRNDASAKQWYPDLVRLAANPVEEIRNTDAWVMGQDNTRPDFHQALLKLLVDASPTVRNNAALALVRFGDASGRAQIVSMLQPVKLVAPRAGRVTDADKPGTAIHQGGVVLKLADDDSGGAEVRSPVSGRVRSVDVGQGQQVTVGANLAIVDPGADQVWEALRALYLIGQPEDLPPVIAYERQLPDMPDRVRQQAVLTEKAIRARSR